LIKRRQHPNVGADHFLGATRRTVPRHP